MQELPQIPPLRTHTTDDGEVLYSIISIIEEMEVSKNPNRYWSDLKRKLKREGFEPYENIVRLKLEAPDGKMRDTDVANRETILRILQSISHPAAEQAKLWMAQLGEERIKEETEELDSIDRAIERAKERYRKQGYNEQWINRRIKIKQVRKILTDEWQSRGVEGRQYSQLTGELHKGTFEVSIRQHKDLKKLGKGDNLRDNMTFLELAFTLLAESTTVGLIEEDDPFGFSGNMESVQLAAIAAQTARRELEKRRGKKVVSPLSFKKFLKGKKDEE